MKHLKDVENPYKIFMFFRPFMVNPL